ARLVAVDEGDLGSAPGQRMRDARADDAGADHCDFHRRLRLSETTRPSLNTSCRVRTLLMFSSGFFSTTMRSASLPASIVPRSAPTPHTPAAFFVAAMSVCQGVAPFLAQRPISSSAASLRGRMSEPSAIFTPALSAFLKPLECSPLAASARQHSECARLRCFDHALSHSLVAWPGV